MNIPKEMVLPGRVLNEDDDFITMEIAKHDGVKFTLQKNADGVTVGGDRFHTVLFLHFEDGGAVIWKPWEADDGDE